MLRIIKNGLTNFGRNIWLSLAATLVMSVTLVIFATLFLLFILTNFSIHTIQNTVDVSVYFKVGFAEEQILKIKDSVQADPQVASVDYVSADQAFSNFKALHQSDPLIAASLNELNSNPLSATLHIKAKSLEDYPTSPRTWKPASIRIL